MLKSIKNWSKRMENASYFPIAFHRQGLPKHHTLLISWAVTALSLYCRETLSPNTACQPIAPVECYHISNAVTPYHLRNMWSLAISNGLKNSILTMSKYIFIIKLNIIYVYSSIHILTNQFVLLHRSIFTCIKNNEKMIH